MFFVAADFAGPVVDAGVHRSHIFFFRFPHFRTILTSFRNCRPSLQTNLIFLFLDLVATQTSSSSPAPLAPRLTLSVLLSSLGDALTHLAILNGRRDLKNTTNMMLESFRGQCLLPSGLGLHVKSKPINMISQTWDFCHATKKVKCQRFRPQALQKSLRQCNASWY